MVSAGPYYHLVPKELQANVEFREKINTLAAKSPENAAVLRYMCSQDILFYVNAFCLAVGTPIVTRRGLVPIERVSRSDQVWDGDKWVSQDGPLCQGRKSTIIAYGLQMTPDHKVWTKHGWQIASKRHDRAEVRLPDGYSARWAVSQHDTSRMAVPMRLREGVDCGRGRTASRPHQRLRLPERWEGHTRAITHTALCGLERNAQSLFQSEEYCISTVRQERDCSLQTVGEVREVPQGHGGKPFITDDNRANQQQRPVQPSQLPMGDSQRTGEQQATTEAEVYDLLNCGPHQAFTVIDSDGRPLLVHNCWTYDPRITERPARPFITYEFQDEAFLEVNDAVQYGHDLLTEKSREMGASWIMATTMEFRWHFFDLQSFLMVSRIEDLVDKKHEPDCLFWKIDFIHQHQPTWLLPRMARQKLSKTNLDTNSTLTGASTTSETSRGGRKTAILFDEFASVPDGYAMLKASRAATKCRLFNSTPKGIGNAFYDTAKKTNIKKLRFFWTQHPLMVAGLYDSVDGKVRILDPSYTYPDGFEFRTDGQVRSPWYDGEEDRCVHPAEMRQEVLIDYLASDYEYFDLAMLDTLVERDVRAPLYQGELDFNTHTLIAEGFEHRSGGRMQLWCELFDDKPPPGEYVMGADIAVGTGASNSCLTVLDKSTGEKVLEFACPHIRPEEFGRLIAPAVGKWFYNAQLIWEATGPGRNFGDALVKVARYSYVYYRTDETSIRQKVSLVPGFWPTRDSKRQVLGEYRRALSHGEFINHSQEALEECRFYIYTPHGPVHVKSTQTIDPTGARANHGDRVIADALAWKLAKTAAALKYNAAPRILYGSLAHRRQEVAKRNRKLTEW